jgi:hypothetical protein
MESKKVGKVYTMNKEVIKVWKRVQLVSYIEEYLLCDLCSICHIPM